MVDIQKAEVYAEKEQMFRNAGRRLGIAAMVKYAAMK